MSKIIKGLLIVSLAVVISAGAAYARGGHGGWHGGHGGWHGGHGGWYGGGWGWGGFAAGAVVGGLLAAPYYYGDPYYYGGPYAYDDCYLRRRLVINRYGHRVWRTVRVCY
jgi:hypothetical protein